MNEPTSQSMTAILRHVQAIKDSLSDIKRSIELIAQEFGAIIKSTGSEAAAIDAIHAEIPAVGLAFWKNIAMVARGDLHPLVLSSGASAVKFLSKLPISEQQRALTEGVPVAVGRNDHRLVPAHLLTTHEIAMATDGSRIRSIAEQQEYFRKEEEKAEKRRKQYLDSIMVKRADIADERSDEVRWVAGKGSVTILACPLTITEKEVCAMLRGMRHG